MTAPAPPARARRPFQEGGLLIVILVLGTLLTSFGGSVKVPKLQRHAAGEMERVFTTNTAGEKELVFEERNKFLNSQSLAQLAKDTSFIAIMAVGATFVIVSGGNQQKVALAKWLARECGILIVDEPTRGVDVGAKAEIHTLLDELACQGLALLVISSELPEIMNLSRSLLVLRGGKIHGELPRRDFSQPGIMRLMAGVEAQAA